MILFFPDFDTLKLALASSIVGPDVTLAPATLTIDPQGHLYVEPSVNLSKTTTKNLDRIGVKGSKRHGSTTPEKVHNWLQFVPLSKEGGTPVLASQAPVLFELEAAGDLPVLVTEMLRLGNDKQSFRWFAEGAEGDQRILLRVLGPPYYTLLRALDKTAAGTTGAVRAYLESAPRVWVEIGHSHPFAKQVRVPEDQLLLIRSPRHWLFLDDAPFQDVYDILIFQLPKLPANWSETSPPKKMTVPLRLAAGNAADVPELWVLRHDALYQLDEFVRDADERLTQRLTFAVASDVKGNRVVVLRTRPSKLAPPALPLENALGFKPFWKLPNLFLPAGKRLHPTLRRDAVRRLLADDPDQVVWLSPDDQGSFIPESVPDSAFRSLEDWVDYVIEMEQAPLASWIEATRFDFEHFVCKEPSAPKPPPQTPDKEPVAKDEEPRVAKPAPSAKPGRAKPTQSTKAEIAPPPEPKPASQWRVLREGLEEKFMATEGSLDSPARRALWPELAAANAGEGSPTEAAICWLNALWSDESNNAEWLAQWARTEFSGASIEAKEFDRRLNAKQTSIENTRAVIVGFLWLANRKPVPEWLAERLPAIQKFLETHEKTMPVRAVWLTAVQLAHRTGTDVLGLARVRDRLLQRLLDEGLNAERDLPMFLRYAGLQDSSRVRLVCVKAQQLHPVVRRWMEAMPVNLPYVDLMFAFALARLGESTTAKRLREQARESLEIPIPWPMTDLSEEESVITAIVGNYMSKTFGYRVDQALEGRPPRDPLPDSLMIELDAIRKKSQSDEFRVKGRNSTSNPFAGAEYMIGRMREQMRILEPNGAQNPYITNNSRVENSAKALSELQAMREPSRRRDAVRRIYRNGVPGETLGEVRLRLLLDELPRAPREGEQYTIELLEYVLALLDPKAANKPSDEYSDTPKRKGELLQRALFLSAHFNRGDVTQKLLSRFVTLVRGSKENDQHAIIKEFAGPSFRSLRKLGMRDDIDRLLTQIQNVVMPDKTLEEVREYYAAQPPGRWSAALQTLLNLASGWLTFGWHDRAQPILDVARTELIHRSAKFASEREKTQTRESVQDFVELARTYIRVLAQDTSERSLERIGEIFSLIPADRVPNTFTTARYFSRFHLNIIEEVILALVSDEFVLGPAGRKWLDGDEYIVRTRIHADMKRERERSGL